MWESAERCQTPLARAAPSKNRPHCSTVFALQMGAEKTRSPLIHFAPLASPLAPTIASEPALAVTVTSKPTPAIAVTSSLPSLRSNRCRRDQARSPPRPLLRFSLPLTVTSEAVVAVAFEPTITFAVVVASEPMHGVAVASKRLPGIIVASELPSLRSRDSSTSSARLRVEAVERALPNGADLS